MNGSLPFHIQSPVVRPRYCAIAMLIGLPLPVAMTMEPFAFAKDPSLHSAEHVAEQVNAVWESGAIHSAVEILAYVCPTARATMTWGNEAAIQYLLLQSRHRETLCSESRGVKNTGTEKRN